MRPDPLRHPCRNTEHILFFNENQCTTKVRLRQEKTYVFHSANLCFSFSLSSRLSKTSPPQPSDLFCIKIVKHTASPPDGRTLSRLYLPSESFCLKYPWLYENVIAKLYRLLIVSCTHSTDTAICPCSQNSVNN